MTTKHAWDEAARLVHGKIQDNLEQLDYLQNHWLLGWWTIGKQEKLLNEVTTLLTKFQFLCRKNYEDSIEEINKNNENS